MDEILRVEKLNKFFQTGSRKLMVLEDINFVVKSGEIVSIVGPSGSGKTTLLGLCAGLDLPNEGQIDLAGYKLTQLTEDERSQLRNQHVGFIFQNFQLLPTLTALENVMVPLELRGSVKGVRERAIALLTRVGLADRMDHYPLQLSGGEQQRVALARAFITAPKVLFADEPTGNLDEETASTVTELLFELNREEGTTLILVTHNMELANQTQRIIQLKGGHLLKEMQGGLVG